MPSQSHVVLKATERVALPGARAIGAANANEWVEITVKLRRQAELPELTGRPKAISRAELDQKYGASQADIDKVSQVLSRYGLEVIDSSPAERKVRFGGPVSAMEQAFQVKLMRYAHERGEYRGRIGVLQVPAELDGIVEGVFGLDNRRVAKRRGAARRLGALTVAKATSRPWFFPAELAEIYAFPAGDGEAQSIGLLELGGGFFPDDLAKFCQAAGVNVPKVIPVSVDHAPTNLHDGQEDEVMLDIEVLAGACPQATIPVYFSRFTEKGWIDGLDAAIHAKENQPTVLSISWGDAEDGASWSAQAIHQVNEVFKEAALLGITVCVASGDDGSDDQVGDGHAHVDFPASSPYVLSVGGTALRKQRGEAMEVAWKDGDGLRQDNGGSSGGGVSVVFDRPTWQNVNIESVNPGAKAGRCVPDVSADASANTGYFIVVDGSANVSGGTSAAAPLWASLIARINETLGAGKHVGYLTPLLYQAQSKGGPIGATTCKDIQSGDNITAAVGGYKAGPGYDAVTGWGTPIGSKLLQALQPIV